MLDLRPALFVVGLLICAIGLAMVVPGTMNWPDQKHSMGGLRVHLTV